MIMKENSFLSRLFSIGDKTPKRSEILKYLSIVGLFVMVAVLVFVFYPNVKQFHYTYEEGSPWKYEDLTAPYAFEIYKSQKEVDEEKDFVMKDFSPIFNRSDDVQNQMLAKMRNKLSVSQEDAQYPYYKYVERKLKEIYKTGIVSPGELDRQNNDGVIDIQVVTEENISHDRQLSSLLTPKKAYEKIMADSPSDLDNNILKSYNLDNYIRPNIVYDSDRTEKLKREMLKNISLTKGKTQAGEKIIDHGEIISSQTYDVLESYKRALEENGQLRDAKEIAIGQAVIIVFCLIVLFMYFFQFRQKYLMERRDVLFILSLVTLMCLVTSWVVRNEWSPYTIPYALIPITVSVFFDTRTALFSHLITVLLCSFIVPNGYEFLFLQTIVGMLSICTLKRVYQQSHLFKAVMLIFCSYVALYLGFSLIHEKNWDDIDLHSLTFFLVNGVFLLFGNPLIYIIEKIFGYTSDSSLVELENTNSPLLRKFAELAPGSFQHSMQVSNLAAECAVALNGKANPILVRTAALYHDIGKMAHPEFFTENQTGGRNAHEGKTEMESAAIIINHVQDGVDIARQNGIPSKIISFIQTHHGESKTKYFLITYKNNHPDEEVDESLFSYPGPKPSTREMAILSMCDAVEAASRSLSSYTDETINDLVEKIVNGQLSDGMFDQAPITLAQIKTIKSVLKDKLKTIYHTRISYPELKKQEK